MKKIVGLIAAGAISLSLTACNNPVPATPAPAGDDDCIVQTTQLEVDDSFCERGEEGYIWVADGDYEEAEEGEEEDEGSEKKDKKKKKRVRR